MPAAELQRACCICRDIFRNEPAYFSAKAVSYSLEAAQQFRSNAATSTSLSRKSERLSRSDFSNVPFLKVLVQMKTFMRWLRCSMVLAGIAVFCSGCGPGGDRAKDKAPDPGADASAGTAVPTGDLSKQGKK